MEPRNRKPRMAATTTPTIPPVDILAHMSADSSLNYCAAHPEVPLEEFAAAAFTFVAVTELAELVELDVGVCVTVRTVGGTEVVEVMGMEVVVRAVLELVVVDDDSEVGCICIS